MSDLVERLYRAAYNEEVGALCNEAAVEIERLRAEEVRMHEAARLRMIEIERLRAALEVYACPGLGKCSTALLDDGTCLRDATGGDCGDHARRALEGK